MKPAKALFFPFIVLLALASCKNDLKLNAPYKEMPSVYAVINPQENVHIIRVNKVFLGEGDANAMAKVADSINYSAGELTISLDRFIGDAQVDAAPITKKRTIVFRDSVIQAEPGAFNTTQRVYVSYDDLHEGLPQINQTTGLNTNPNWKVSGNYVLTVKNNRTGNIFRAKSTIIDSVKLTNARPFAAPFYPYPPNTNPLDYVDYSDLNQTYSLRFNPNEAQIYQVVVRMNFYDIVGPYNYYRSVDYTGTNLDVSRDKRINNGTSYMVSEFKGRDVFYSAGLGMAKQGLTDQVSGRKMYEIEYYIYSATQDYADYLEFVKPSLNITQNKPLYSNFENRAALGIFTFRSRFMVKKEMANSFINAFSDNENTCYYKFLTTTNSYRGCK